MKLNFMGKWHINDIWISFGQKTPFLKSTHKDFSPIWDNCSLCQMTKQSLSNNETFLLSKQSRPTFHLLHHTKTTWSNPNSFILLSKQTPLFISFIEPKVEASNPIVSLNYQELANCEPNATYSYWLIGYYLSRWSNQDMHISIKPNVIKAKLEGELDRASGHCSTRSDRWNR